MEHIIAWISSFVLGIGVVWKIIEKYSPKVRKALKISAETLELLNHILEATDDKKITKEEVEKIMLAVEDLQAALK